MKKWNRLTKIVAGATLLVALIATTAYAANSQPGSVNDPIVTKSYVDEQLQLLKKQLGGGAPATGGSADTSILHFVKLKLEPNQILFGEDGTEIIVRSGIVKVVAGDQGDGISDLTGGQDLLGNQAIPLNHLLLIPRTDHRGLVVDKSSKDCWVMVRGGYEIK